MADITHPRRRARTTASSEIVHGIDLDIARRRVRRHSRAVGLRQVDAAAHDRRPGGRSPPARSRSTARVVNKLEPRERGCAMVFQNYALYPHMTVAENIGYA